MVRDPRVLHLRRPARAAAMPAGLRPRLGSGDEGHGPLVPGVDPTKFLGPSAQRLAGGAVLRRPLSLKFDRLELGPATSAATFNYHVKEEGGVRRGGLIKSDGCLFLAPRESGVFLYGELVCCAIYGRDIMSPLCDGVDLMADGTIRPYKNHQQALGLDDSGKVRLVPIDDTKHLLIFSAILEESALSSNFMER